MEKRKMIKQIYQKTNILVGEDYIDNIMKDEKRVEAFMKLYEREKIKFFILFLIYENYFL